MGRSIFPVFQEVGSPFFSLLSFLSCLLVSIVIFSVSDLVRRVIMEVSEMYLCVFGGSFVMMMLIRVCWRISYAATPLIRILDKHIRYRNVLNYPHRWTWGSRLALLGRCTYLAANLVMLLYGQSKSASVANQAGVLAVINMIPLYLGMYHASTADWLGLPLMTFRSLHRDTAAMTTLMGTIHTTLTLIQSPSFAWTDSQQVHGVAVTQVSAQV